MPWPLWAPRTGSPAEPVCPGSGELWRAGHKCVGVGHPRAASQTPEDYFAFFFCFSFFNKCGFLVVRISTVQIMKR